ncbi:hypothetical protein LZ30DRAFT_774722 [Colletotrichum cereale]|nr:hypothetical protein LZ30DRAFT_774722 [Colletotrichum cereale]
MSVAYWDPGRSSALCSAHQPRELGDPSSFKNSDELEAPGSHTIESLCMYDQRRIGVVVKVLEVDLFLPASSASWQSPRSIWVCKRGLCNTMTDDPDELGGSLA